MLLNYIKSIMILILSEIVVNCTYDVLYLDSLLSVLTHNVLKLKDAFSIGSLNHVCFLNNVSHIIIFIFLGFFLLVVHKLRNSLYKVWNINQSCLRTCIAFPQCNFNLFIFTLVNANYSHIILKIFVYFIRSKVLDIVHEGKKLEENCK